VNFSPGAVNVFHTHTSDQILYVTEGKGIVATENEEVTVTPGTIIFIPAGERHWHGATKETAFSHIFISPVRRGILASKPWISSAKLKKLLSKDTN